MVKVHMYNMNSVNQPASSIDLQFTLYIAIDIYLYPIYLYIPLYCSAYKIIVIAACMRRIDSCWGYME